MNHPAFHQAFIAEHTERLEREARRAFLRKSGQVAARSEVPVSLRLCTVHDDAALAQLAALDGRRLPSGSFVLVEVGGKLVAAQPLGGGAPLADPFHPTAELLPLLRLRARQLETGASRHGFFTRSWSAVRGY
jgi:hypothetical protein